MTQSIGKQQSHHCGIETCEGLYRFACLNLQQSHHCGIETLSCCVAELLNVLRSNRTIVGLKLEAAGG